MFENKATKTFIKQFLFYKPQVNILIII